MTRARQRRVVDAARAEIRIADRFIAAVQAALGVSSPDPGSGEEYRRGYDAALRDVRTAVTRALDGAAPAGA